MGPRLDRSSSLFIVVDGVFYRVRSGVKAIFEKGPLFFGAVKIRNSHSLVKIIKIVQGSYCCYVRVVEFNKTYPERIAKYIMRHDDPLERGIRERERATDATCVSSVTAIFFCKNGPSSVLTFFAQPSMSRLSEKTVFFVSKETVFFVPRVSAFPASHSSHLLAQSVEIALPWSSKI